MKKLYGLFVAVLLIAVGAVGVFVFVMPQKEFSDNENRYLSQIPVINKRDILSGDFQKDMIEGLSDQFLERDLFMQIATKAKKILGYRDIGGVYIAKDGYYINRVSESDINQSDYIKNLRYVQYFADTQQANTFLMLVPSAGTILTEKLPKYADYYNADKMYDAEETVISSAGIVDIREALKKEKHNSQVYFKTDHHWTLNGAYQGYAEFCKKAGMVAKPYDSFEVEKKSSDFYGTLYSKVIDREAESDSLYAARLKNKADIRVMIDDERVELYDEAKLQTKDKYAYFFGGNYGKVVIKTGSASGKKLLVVKDSFANSFVPFLLDDYSEIIMLDLRYYDAKSYKQDCLRNKYDNILILYELSNFAQDHNLYKLVK